MVQMKGWSNRRGITIAKLSVNFIIPLIYIVLLEFIYQDKPSKYMFSDLFNVSIMYENMHF